MSSIKKNNNDSKTLELGDIYFFYRPKVKAENKKDRVHAMSDIQRFYIVLHPRNTRLYRLIILGAKRLPEIKKKHEKNWAVVDFVTLSEKALVKELGEHRYVTKTKGRRFLPASRPVGEGVYSIMEQGKNTYLSYLLELPKKRGGPQHALKIQPNASYVVSVKNPSAPGRMVSKPVEFPANLKKLFGNLRFIPLKSPKLLNYSGAELLIIGAHTGNKKVKIPLNKQHEDIDSAAIFNDLQLWKNDHSIVPLFKGEWR